MSVNQIDVNAVNQRTVSMAEYPHEMYCKTCGKAVAYTRIDGTQPENIGLAIRADECINLDGTKPKAGDAIVCECSFDTLKSPVWSTRKRV